jgi:dGTPase
VEIDVAPGLGDQSSAELSEEASGGRDLCGARSLVPTTLAHPRQARRQNRGSDDRRSSAQRDLARVLYSPYFQRLAGVTQVVSPDPRVPQFHTRQTHSLKVSLVAKELAEDLISNARSSAHLGEMVKDLGGIDSVVCETAGLAHDLGHPPFGHLGEVLLNKFMRYEPPFADGSGDVKGSDFSTRIDPSALELCDVDAVTSNGFEGNAQTFRIVTRLDRHRVPDDLGNYVGLDLTPATLASLLKYPWWRSEGEGKFSKKYGAYPDDVSAFVDARGWTKNVIPLQQQTLEASIMDLADDITYAVHDLQDFMLAGMFDPRDAVKSLEQQLALMEKTDYVDFNGEDLSEVRRRLLHEKHTGKIPSPLEDAYRKASEHQRGVADRQSYKDALGWALEYFMTDLHEHYTGALRRDVQIRKAFSEIVGSLLSDVTCSRETLWPGGPYINPSRDSWHRIQILKTLGRSLIVNSVHVGVVQRSQQAALVSLLTDLNAWLLTSPPLIEDGELGEHSVVRHRGVRTRRCITDHVCSLTDFKAMQWAEWLRGGSLPVLGDL